MTDGIAVGAMGAVGPFIPVDPVGMVDTSSGLGERTGKLGQVHLVADHQGICDETSNDCGSPTRSDDRVLPLVHLVHLVLARHP